MTTTKQTTKTTTETTRKKPKRRTKLLSEGMDVDRAPIESRRQASCVLEVLAGLRTPEGAAAALGISVPTYYHLETRALRGLVHGCAPEPPGRKQSLLRQVREAEAQRVELERQLQRYRALLRSAQRAAGVVAEPAETAKAKRRSEGGKSRKARKPRVRALRAIDALAAPPGDGDAPAAPDDGAKAAPAPVEASS